MTVVIRATSPPLIVMGAKPLEGELAFILEAGSKKTMPLVREKSRGTVKKQTVKIQDPTP